MRAIWITGGLALGLAFGQTQVDVKTQTRNVNLSSASFVIPFPTGTALPSTCSTGSMFFNSAAPAGSNLYGCVATNLWAVQAGSAAATAGLLTATQSSSQVVEIGPTCSGGAPCLVKVGSTVNSYFGPSTVTITGGSGTVYFYVDGNGNVNAGESAAGAPALTCAGCVLASPVEQFPPGTIPIAIWTASGGTWLTGTNEAALEGGAPTFTGGTNVTLTQTGNSVSIAASLEALPSGAQPACSSTTGGFLWYIPGASGVQDHMQLCAKDATNTYAWRTLY